MLTIPWWVIKNSLGLSNALIHTSSFSPDVIFKNINQLPNVLRALWLHGLDFKNYNITYIFFGLLFCCNLRKSATYPYKYLLLLSALHLSFIMLVYLLIPFELYAVDPLVRLLIPVDILGVLYLVLAAAK